MAKQIYLFSIFVLATIAVSSVAASQKYTRNFTLGHRVPGDRLEFHGRIEKKSGLLTFGKIEEEKTFKAVSGNVISCIIALDLKTKSHPEVKVKNGGIGSEQVTLKIKSESGHGINHEIFVYSQPRIGFAPSVIPQQPSHPVPSYPVPSHPAPSHPVPSYPVPNTGNNVYPGQVPTYPGINQPQHPGNTQVFGGSQPVPSAPSAGSLYPSLPTIGAGQNQYPSGYVNPNHPTYRLPNSTQHGKNNTLIVGSRSFQDSLELQESITKPAEVSVKHKFNKNFKIRRDYKISQVVVEDRGLTGAKAKYEEFGPGHNNVTIEFESERGKGVDFVVRLYGHH